jgi:hypothetical protein
VGCAVPWNPTAKEIEAIFKLEPAERYEYFIKRVADEGEVWSLRGSAGWVLAADGDGHESVPVWPHRVYAASCATGGWHGCHPASLDLDEWITRWLPGIEKDRRAVAVFPIPSGSGTPVTPSRLRADLEAELTKYG